MSERKKERDRERGAFPLKSYSRRRKGHYTKKGELSWFLGREVRTAELSGKPFLGRKVFMQEPRPLTLTFAICHCLLSY